MKLPGYYSSGQFAGMADVSLRTIRFYDKQNILKPSYVNPSGARFYTDADFARLQQILLFKYLGFSLEDIRELVINDADDRLLLSSLKLQRRLIQDRIEQLQQVEGAIGETEEALAQSHRPDWSKMLQLIHLTDMDKSLRAQYQNASNISARIQLHGAYSVNKQGWFPWVFEQCRLRDGMHVLELGCGDGTLWAENLQNLCSFPKLDLVLSDRSDGMLRDAKRRLTTLLSERQKAAGSEPSGGYPSISFRAFSCEHIPYADATFDLVIANHLLFYCEDIPGVCGEVRRVLKPEGHFLCSTYGSRHMQEIRQLVQEFDSHILLSADELYERFGLDNGGAILRQFFSKTELLRYEDAIELSEAQPLIEYILSCHGNQNRILLDRYKEFRSFVERKVKGGFHITKEAGLFRCACS